MKTITIDTINTNAFRLLIDLELLQLIRVHNEPTTVTLPMECVSRNKSKMI